VRRDSPEAFEPVAESTRARAGRMLRHIRPDEPDVVRARRAAITIDARRRAALRAQTAEHPNPEGSGPPVP
jgi:hypothetical protein